MQTLELECPACGELLELDAGFAGGVCRCSACGTLMTVPHDAAHGEQAEQLSRPDRPDDPSGMSGFEPVSEPEEPSRPSSRAGDRRRGGASSRRSSSRGGRRGKDKGRGKGKGKGKRAPGRTGERVEQGVYKTASGKTINIDRAMDVPTARTRRTGVRIATFVVFFSIVGLVVAAGAVAVVWMLQNPKGGPPPEDPYAVVHNDDPTQFIYTRSANPFMLEQPNVVGLPIHGTVAVVIDTRPASRGWVEPLAEMVAAGLSRPGGEAKVLLFRAGDDGVQSFRGSPVAPNTVTAQALTSFVTETRGTGDAGVAEGIRRALLAKPDMLIVITGQPTGSDMTDWGNALVEVGPVELNVVLVSGFSDELRDLVKGLDNGRLISLTTSDILDWQEGAAAEEE